MPDVALNLRYAITFTSAFHIGTGYGLAGFVDATVVRRGDGNLYVPGSSIKGRARWCLTGLLGSQPWDHDLTPCSPAVAAGETRGLCELCNLFGSTRTEPTLFFSDAVLAGDVDWARQAAEASRDPRMDAHELATLQTASQVERRSQVSISRRRRVSRDELLFVTEVGQAGLRFTGTVEGRLPDMGRLLRVGDGQQIPVDLGWLLAALQAVERIGGRKSRGLGYCNTAITSVRLGRPGDSLASLADPAAVLRALRQEMAR